MTWSSCLSFYILFFRKFITNMVSNSSVLVRSSWTWVPARTSGGMLDSAVRVGGMNTENLHKTNPNPNPISTLAASPARPTPAHGATCHLPESASPTCSGWCHQTPLWLPLPPSPAALISCPSTAACPTSLGCGPSSSMLRLRQKLTGGPGCARSQESQIPASTAPTASPQVPPSPVRPSPSLGVSTVPHVHHLNAPPDSHALRWGWGSQQAVRIRWNNAHCTPETF